MMMIENKQKAQEQFFHLRYYKYPVPEAKSCQERAPSSDRVLFTAQVGSSHHGLKPRMYHIDSSKNNPVALLGIAG